MHLGSFGKFSLASLKPAPSPHRTHPPNTPYRPPPTSPQRFDVTLMEHFLDSQRPLKDEARPAALLPRPAPPCARLLAALALAPPPRRHTCTAVAAAPLVPCPVPTRAFCPPFRLL